MPDNTGSTSQSTDGLASVLTAGLGDAAKAFTAYEAASTAKQALKKGTSPTNLLIVGGIGLALVLVLVFAVKK